jgi:hypothetical protein
MACKPEPTDYARALEMNEGAQRAEGERRGSAA